MFVAKDELDDPIHLEAVGFHSCSESVLQTMADEHCPGIAPPPPIREIQHSLPGAISLSSEQSTPSSKISFSMPRYFF
jgi:hypothetical protein